MNNPAASSGVSKPKTTAKVYAPRGGELDPKRLNSRSHHARETRVPPRFAPCAPRARTPPRRQKRLVRIEFAHRFSHKLRDVKGLHFFCGALPRRPFSNIFSLRHQKILPKQRFASRAHEPIDCVNTSSNIFTLALVTTLPYLTVGLLNSNGS